MILLDTSGMLAALDRGSRVHEAARAVLEAHSGPRLLSPFVLAELDCLVTRDQGQEHALRLLDDVVKGAHRLEQFAATDVADAREVIMGHADLRVGLADASIVVLAQRHRCADVLTLDERHFRVLPGPEGRPFRLLPADHEGATGR